MVNSQVILIDSKPKAFRDGIGSKFGTVGIAIDTIRTGEIDMGIMPEWLIPNRERYNNDWWSGWLAYDTPWWLDNKKCRLCSWLSLS